VRSLWPLIAAAVVAAIGCSKDQRCEGDTSSVHVEVSTRDVTLASSAHSILVVVLIAERRVEKTIDLAQDFLDGSASLSVPLDPKPSGSYSAEVIVTAYDLPSGRGRVLGSQRGRLENGASCATVSVEIQPGVIAGEDGGVPIEDAGSPRPDAGLDAGGGDVPIADPCGNGTVETTESCDDGNGNTGDGCAQCRVEPGWMCSGSPSRCMRQVEGEFAFRRVMIMHTGNAMPSGGYTGYTLRIAGLDTATAIAQGQLRADCQDLRVVLESTGMRRDLARHVLRCGEADTEIRFQARTEISRDEDGVYYLYWGAPNIQAAEPLGTDNVYLWYDDGTVDRSSAYTSGRFDDMFEGWASAASWDPNGYYAFDTGDNYSAGFRPPVDERDVYVEAELMHLGCYPANMTTGVFTRYTTTSTSADFELSDSYYLMVRGYQQLCQGTAAMRYAYDGSIVKGSRSTIVIPGGERLPVPLQTWRKVALATWGPTPSYLTGWDADEPWTTPGWPGMLPTVSGQDMASIESSGAVGFVVAQDACYVRNILVRRFIEPEPLVELGPEERLR
jgi:cysteine-rich repeat protein